jgi:hypothetical protein
MKATTRPGRGFVADYYFRGKRITRSFKTAELRDAHLAKARTVLDQERIERIDRKLPTIDYAIEWLTELEESIQHLRRRLLFEKQLLGRVSGRSAR